MKIYHNSKCSKSNIALKELQDSGEEFEVLNYLENSPSVEELTLLVDMLGIKPFGLVRTTEQIYKDQYKGKEMTDADWLVAMHQNPILIQRPIVVRNAKAVIARTDDALDEIFG